MSAQDSAGRSHKTLVESAICFGCMAAALTAAAVVLKWLLHFLY